MFGRLILFVLSLQISILEASTHFLVLFSAASMASSNKIMNKKAHSSVEDDSLSLLANVELGLSSPFDPVSTPKKSKVDTTKGGGESAPA